MSPDVKIASERVAFYVSHLPYFARRGDAASAVIEAWRTQAADQRAMGRVS